MLNAGLGGGGSCLESLCRGFAEAVGDGGIVCAVLVGDGGSTIDRGRARVADIRFPVAEGDVVVLLVLLVLPCPGTSLVFTLVVLDSPLVAAGP